MGSLPDSKYIIKTDGYWFVEAHDVDPSKGYISVSAKGIVNGLSNIPNDGADFGPDSYNPNYSGSGIPYTQTSGIQEALTYIHNNTVNYIKLNDGTFEVSETITMPADDYIHFVGSRNSVIIPTQTVTSVIDISNIGKQCVFSDFTVASGLNSAGTSSLSTYCIYGSSTGTHTGFQTLFRNIIFWTFETYPVYITTTGNSYGGMIFDNVSDTLVPSGYYQTLGMYVSISSGNMLRIINSHFNGLVDITASEMVIVNCSFFGIKVSITEGIGSIVSSNLYGSQNYNVNAVGNPCNIQLSGRLSLIACYIPNNGQLISTTVEDLVYLSNPTNGVGYLSAVNCFINLSNPHTTNIINGDATIPYNININKAIIDGDNQTLDCHLLTDSALSNYMFLHNVSYSRTGSVTFSDIPTNSPTLTTNPPVSGTAYQNTNPYDILIYLPVYTSTSGTAGNIKASIGPTSTPATQVVNDIVNSGTSSSNPRTIQLKVPAGWWYEFTGTTTTFGTATVVAD